MFKKLKKKSTKPAEIETKQEKKEINQKNFLVQGQCPANNPYVYNADDPWLKWYALSSAVYTAISLLAQEISSLKPMVWDTSKDEFVDHEVLSLLRYPNKFQSYQEFMEEASSLLIASGNLFVTAEGNTKRPPLFLHNYSINDVTATPSFFDKFPLTYSLTGNRTYNTTYKRLDGIGKRMMYVDDTGSSAIFQLKTFNPSTYDLYGMSPLTPVYQEIMQLQLSNTHNLSMLELGARCSAIISTADSISDDKFEAIKSAFQNNFSGASNAGQVIIVDEQELNYKELSTSNKDMDFLKLKENVTHAIYNELKIPLPLISAEQMTFNNSETARLGLYDNAVMPWANKIFTDLTSFLMPRYPNSENLVITYDKDSISALQTRRTEELERLNNLNVMTANEVRARINLDKLEGGENLYQPQSQIAFAGPNIEEQSAIQENETREHQQLEQLIKSMKSQKNELGNPIFTNEEIKLVINRMKN